MDIKQMLDGAKGLLAFVMGDKGKESLDKLEIVFQRGLEFVQALKNLQPHAKEIYDALKEKGMAE